MELLQTFEYEELKVETFYIGTSYLAYKVYLYGVLVDEGEDFKPSMLHSIDDTDTMVSLLGFLVLQAGVVDDEYFATVPAQLFNWANDIYSSRDNINQMLNDWDMRDDEDLLAENEMTYEDCIKIEKYIITE